MHLYDFLSRDLQRWMEARLLETTMVTHPMTTPAIKYVAHIATCDSRSQLFITFFLITLEGLGPTQGADEADCTSEIIPGHKHG